MGAPESVGVGADRLREARSFNGAGAWELRKDRIAFDGDTEYILLQWGRSLGAPERRRSPANSWTRRRLQWGRSLGAPERYTYRDVGQHWQLASMGPELGSSGKVITEDGGRGFLDMLQWGRSLGAPESGNTDCRATCKVDRFNGAGAWELRKVGAMVEWSTTGDQLQWGRSLGAPESRGAIEMTILIQALQWGRSLGAPERLPPVFIGSFIR